MKKRKISLWLNIVTICLSICAIAIGVYSIKTASLNINGAIGFTAHNCNVDIVASMYGDSAASDSSTASSTASGVVRSEANAKQFAKINVDGDTKTLDLGTIYFCDMTVGGKINPITLNFVITNKSAFYVDLTVDRNCINNNRIFIYAPNNGETLAPNASATIVIQLKLQKDGSDKYSSLDNVVNLSNASLFKFEQSQAPAYLATDWKDKIEKVFTGGYEYFASVSFVREVNDTILNGYEKNSDGTYKTVSVGAVNGTGIDGNLTTDVSDVVAYCKLTENTMIISEIIIYSPARIYAPQDCNSFFAEGIFARIDLSNFDTSNVTNMSKMFYNCGITLLNLSNFDTSQVTDMNNMFFGYSDDLEGPDQDLSNFNTSKVKNMENMFYGSMLENLDLSNFDTREVTNMSGMFSSSSYDSLDLSSFDTSKVVNMSKMFEDSSILTTIYVNSSKWSTANVTSSNNMFNKCTKLVGGAGTKFTSSQIDKTYARVDGGTSNPGYLTAKA